MSRNNAKAKEKRLRKPPIIPPHNEYNIKDLTPHNASRVMRGMNIKYK